MEETTRTLTTKNGVEITVYRRKASYLINGRELIDYKFKIDGVTYKIEGIIDPPYNTEDVIIIGITARNLDIPYEDPNYTDDWFYNRLPRRKIAIEVMNSIGIINIDTTPDASIAHSTIYD